MLNKTYDPTSFEKTWYEAWQAAGHFSCDPDSERPPYTIMMPPPNVTGSLHIGHALTFTLQDILIRFHRMRGHDALWQPGMDHAGIATQMVVERNLAKDGISRRDLGRDKFIERIWDWKSESGGMISRQLRSLGASADWPRERFTMDAGLSSAVRKVFVEMHRDGLIYRDKRLVNWDPKLQTAISDLEVEQKESQGHYWHLRYPIEGSDETITVATTRPETMLGDTAIAVHPDDDRYRHLVGKMARLPIVGRLIPIIADDYSDMDKGTGAVKITPAHDFNDFEVGRRNNLEMINIFDAEAKTNENVPLDWQGIDRFEARQRVVDFFESEGLLADVTETEHSVPHGDRSGVVIEPWLMDQWYVDAKILAEPAIKAVEDGRTRIIPQRWEKTYFEWMRNIQPWCVSRQLWWGHRIPAWYGPDGTPFVAMDDAEAAAMAETHYGAPTLVVQDEDVLDTWFSSGLWPFSTLGWPQDTKELNRYYPGDVLVTGFDIIFFWVARMMMMSMHFMDGEVPFRDVYIHALVRDEKGQKMSKSKGNVMDPLIISEKYGADALRFTLTAMAAQGRDIKLAENRIESYRNFATKIWNACRFLQVNDCVSNDDFDLSHAAEPFNQWIIHELAEAEAKIAQAVENYRFNEAADTLYKFIWNHYCDWYLELIKPSLSSDNAAALDETRLVASHVMAAAIKMLHPFMPFISEELWQKLWGGGDMLIASAWPKITPPTDNKAATEIGFVIDLITSVRSVRNEMNVPNAATPDLLILTPTEERRTIITSTAAQIKRLGRIGGIEFTDTVPPQSAQSVVDGLDYALPLAGILDFDAERARLTKAIKAAEGEIKKLSSKLGNQGFLAKAPDDVIKENERRLAAERDQCERLSRALERLG